VGSEGKGKAGIAVHGTPSHSYGVTLAIMGSHSIACYPTQQVSTPRLHPGQSGRYSIYLPQRDGRRS